MSSLNTATRTDRCAFFSRLKPSRIASVVLLALFVETLVIQVQQTTSTQPRPTPTETTDTFKEPADRRAHRPLTSPRVFDSNAFHRTIIDNNLFRPLGWTPPRPSEPYRLIGTIWFPRRANTPPQAILQSTAGKTTYIVTLGDKIDALTEVVSIEGKQVILSTNGKQRTLHLSIRF